MTELQNPENHLIGYYFTNTERPWGIPSEELAQRILGSPYRPAVILIGGRYPERNNPFESYETVSYYLSGSEEKPILLPAIRFLDRQLERGGKTDIVGIFPGRCDLISFGKRAEGVRDQILEQGGVLLIPSGLGGLRSEVLRLWRKQLPETTIYQEDSLWGYTFPYSLLVRGQEMIHPFLAVTVSYKGEAMDGRYYNVLPRKPENSQDVIALLQEGNVGSNIVRAHSPGDALSRTYHLINDYRRSVGLGHLQERLTAMRKS